MWKTPTQGKHSRKIKADRKSKRNSGKEYHTLSGKLRKARKMTPLPNCRLKCKSKIPEDKCTDIFNEYWGLQSFNRRSAFVASSITIYDKATSRPRAENPDDEKVQLKTYKYFLDVDGEKINVCKGCFLKILRETDNFMNLVALKKRTSVGGLQTSDNRGLQAPKNRWGEDKMEEIRTHLKQFPAYESHYN